MVFYKMHGLSNDYIFMDCFKQPVDEPKELAKKLSLRHTSVGADGLILICPSFVADCKMVMYNADGSEGKMCGNGIRCVGKYVYEKGIVTKKNISVETASGIKHIYLTVSGGKVILVKVDLGIQEFFPAKIPIIDELEEDSFIRRRIMIPSGEEIVSCVSVGNPHCVIFREDIYGDISFDGKSIEKNSIFPEGVNVSFARMINRREIELRVWERGTGETFACGTGAAATVVIAAVLDYCPRDEEITVKLKGGKLYVNYGVDGKVYIDGPAKMVYTGIIEE